MPPPVVRNHVERQTDVWAPIQLHFKLCDALGLGSQFADTDTDTDTNTDSNWDWVKKGTTHGTASGRMKSKLIKYLASG